jgi:hypothetical protein
MPNDPGLAPDTCLFVEAVSGDGGVHNGNGVWWLSPDVTLTGATSGPDKADPGQHNTVQVTFHRKGAASNCQTRFSESVTVEVWVGNPSLVMTPNNPASTTRIEWIGSPMPAEGTNGVQMVDWVPLTGLPPTDPQSAGHKCLIARCYPDALTPSSAAFFAPDDPHVAQHNICIVPCGGPGAAARPGPCSFLLSTVNPNLKQADTVIVRAIADLKPIKFVRDVVLSRLKGVTGFRRLATIPPAGFRLQSPAWRGAEVTDRSRTRGKRAPSYEARVKLARGRFVTFTFHADLSKGKLGDAYIFHLTQTGSDRRPQGGLTLVMVAV